MQYVDQVEFLAGLEWSLNDDGWTGNRCPFLMARATPPYRLRTAPYGASAQEVR